MNQELFLAFKAYDIRGESPQVIDRPFAANLGLAVAKVLSPKRVMVGRDMRQTSPELEMALVESLVSQGIDVVKIGLCSTPMFNVLLGLADPKFDLGIMITASHNPGKYNGFKLTDGDCLPLGLGSGLERIRDAWPAEGEVATSVALPGSVTEDPTSLDRYVDHIVKLADMPSDMPNMHVVIDAGNGMAGYIVSRLLERCPWLKAERLFFELDGNFPNHEANPLKEETLMTLKKRVAETGAVCGVAFDGDADRVGFMDEEGEQFRGDLLTSFFATIELREKPGGIVLSDTRASWSLAKEVAAAGGRLEWCKVGHANIKKMMRETDAVFSGELSMHFYFKELWNVESGDYAMLILLKELAAKRQTLSSLRKSLTHYFHSGEINFTVKDTKSVLDKIRQVYGAQATRTIDIDGLRYEFGDPEKDPQAWWLSIRSSNTEPLVRLNLEAVTKELMEQKIQEVSNLIKTA